MIEMLSSEQIPGLSETADGLKKLVVGIEDVCSEWSDVHFLFNDLEVHPDCFTEQRKIFLLSQPRGKVRVLTLPVFAQAEE